MEGRRQLRIANCETGNPPEGWKSEGQLRIWKQGDRRSSKLKGGIVETVEIVEGVRLVN